MANRKKPETKAQISAQTDIGSILYCGRAYIVQISTTAKTICLSVPSGSLLINHRHNCRPNRAPSGVFQWWVILWCVSMVVGAHTL